MIRESPIQVDPVSTGNLQPHLEPFLRVKNLRVTFPNGNGGLEALDKVSFELAAQESLSKGITTFEDAGSSFATIDRMRRMVDEGRMGVRLWVMVREGNEREAPRLPVLEPRGIRGRAD